MDREKWLKSLKEGDKVWNSGEDGYNFHTIKKITPTGKIRLDNDVLLNKNGYGSRGYRFNNTYYEIEPITQEILKKIKQRKDITIATKKLKEAWEDIWNSKLNIEQLNKLIDFLDSFKIDIKQYKNRKEDFDD